MIQHLSSDKQTSDPDLIICTGDIVLDEPNPDYWLSGLVPALRDAQLVIGHLEVPHSNSTMELKGDVPAPGADPSHLDALARAGFHGMTLAGNHMADCGSLGIEDTIAGLDRLGIGHCGAGCDAGSARQAAVFAVGSRAVGLLSYNAVGPANAWAGSQKAGCAYLPVDTLDGLPPAPASTFTRPLPECEAILNEDISKAREQADLVIVALHKGTVHTPALVEPYEHALADIAVRAGADVIISHHAHIIRGITCIKGVPVFHGLGNGCVVTRALSPAQDHPERAAWALRRKALFGFEPDPDYVLAPFHPQAKHAFMARILWYPDGRLETGVIPVYVDPPGRPRLAEGQEVDAIMATLATINREAGLGELTLHKHDKWVSVA